MFTSRTIWRPLNRRGGGLGLGGLQLGLKVFDLALECGDVAAGLLRRGQVGLRRGEFSLQALNLARWGGGAGSQDQTQCEDRSECPA